MRAVADFCAAILGAVGFVGKPRRRAGIRDDLKLLDELSAHPDFGRGSWPHQALMNRIALDVARLSGVSLKQRTTSWSSIVIALLVGGPLAFWTFKLNADGFVWYSLFPGLVAGFMAISILGMLLPSQDESVSDEGEEDMLIRPPAGDINAARTSEAAAGSAHAPESDGDAMPSADTTE